MPTVTRVDKSPMNNKVKVVELSCGHDAYVRSPKRAPRIGSKMTCPKNTGPACKD